MISIAYYLLSLKTGHSANIYATDKKNDSNNFEIPTSKPKKVTSGFGNYSPLKWEDYFENTEYIDNV